MTHRLSINVPDETWETILRLAGKRDTSATDIVISAVFVENWIDELVAKGGRLVKVEGDGTWIEVQFR